MIYVKSLAADITVVLATLLSSLLIGHPRLQIQTERSERLDLISFAKTPLAWLIVAVIFMVGFVWEFRHIKA